MAHGFLVLLAAVGVCVGFIASVMYLVQLQRLRAKVPPGQGMKQERGVGTRATAHARLQASISVLATG